MLSQGTDLSLQAQIMAVQEENIRNYEEFEAARKRLMESKRRLQDLKALALYGNSSQINKKV